MAARLTPSQGRHPCGIGTAATFPWSRCLTQRKQPLSLYLGRRMCQLFWILNIGFVFRRIVQHESWAGVWTLCSWHITRKSGGCPVAASDGETEEGTSNVRCLLCRRAGEMQAVGVTATSTGGKERLPPKSPSRAPAVRDLFASKIAFDNESLLDSTGTSI